MERRTPKSFWRAKKQDYKSTSTLSSEERRKIQNGNRLPQDMPLEEYYLKNRMKNGNQ